MVGEWNDAPGPPVNGPPEPYERVGAPRDEEWEYDDEEEGDDED